MIRDFVKAMAEGRVLELFGTGTAVNVVSINKIHFRGDDYEVKVDEAVGLGPFAGRLRQQLQDIQHGAIPHEWMEPV